VQSVSVFAVGRRSVGASQSREVSVSVDMYIFPFPFVTLSTALVCGCGGSTPRCDVFLSLSLGSGALFGDASVFFLERE